MDSESIPERDEEISFNEGDEDEEEFTSTSQVLERFEEVWLNEKFCPELLSFENELVECLRDQISHMEGNLAKLKPGDFRSIVHQMELERIRYMITSYLRIRLAKIEKYGAHLLEVESRTAGNSFMSEQERKFAQEFVTVTENYLKDVAVQHLPANVQEFSLASTAAKPKLDDYVFIKMKKETMGILVDEATAETREEIMDFEKDSQHIIRYRPISHLIKNSKAKLI